MKITVILNVFCMNMDAQAIQQVSTGLTKPVTQSEIMEAMDKAILRIIVKPRGVELNFRDQADILPMLCLAEEARSTGCWQKASHAYGAVSGSRRSLQQRI